MKSVRDEIKKIWHECFDDTREYVEMYFDRVFRESDAMTLEQDGHIVSSLLLQSYGFKFQGVETTVSYIAGAATKRSARGQGNMSRLILLALQESRQRGDIMCTLIPAHDWLYFYYDRFGFTTIFYSDRQRYTSLHNFSGRGEYSREGDCYSDRVYDAFHELEDARPCGVIHSRRDFLNTLDDLRFDDGGTFVVMNDDKGKVASMAWAVKENGLVVIKDILSVDQEGRQAVLRELRGLFPDLPFMVLAIPEDNIKRHLYSQGMGRVVNVEKLLQITARHHPKTRSHIKVTDPLLPANSHTFTIEEGQCTVTDDYKGPLDLDVSIEVFTDIVFSSPTIGEIMGFPSERPHMSLMLD